MSVPPVLNVYRHDTDSRAPVTRTGEIDLSSAPLVHASLEQSLHDGIHAIHVDGTAAPGGSLQLHHPSPALERLVALTGSGSLFLALPDAPAPAALPGGVL
jgi:anti-sigma B factor antagonist